MSATRSTHAIRQKDTSLRIAIDGEDKVGWMKVVSFRTKPEMTIKKTQFCGQKFPEGDVDCDGWTITFEVFELDATAEDVLHTMYARHKAGLAQPRVVLTEFKQYRGSGAESRTNVYMSTAMICTEITNSEGGNYVSSKWEAFVSERDSLD